jgi:CheY-like chemotaxis protein
VQQEPEVPPAIHCDGPKVRQILINLISNAIRNTEHGGVILRVRSAETDRPRHVQLCFEVADSGIGIAPVDQARIFEPFTQADNSHSLGGTGLGLAITRKYVELMGGSMAVDSTVDFGSHFRVELPFETAALLPVEGSDADARSMARAPDRPIPYRVLVVDDDENSLRLLERLLQAAGFQVCLARNGHSAIAGFREFRPEFIWMDWHMPGIDGLEATRRIREMEGGRETKIAAVTASAFDEQRAELMAAGLDDFVRKPYRPEQIFDCMARHLGMRFAPRYNSLPSHESGVRGLSPDALIPIPKAQRMQLADALISLDVERVNAVISEIAQLDEGLGAILNHYAESFAYTELLGAIEPREATTQEGSL